jgi:Flp pilus assembly pilin Flp
MSSHRGPRDLRLAGTPAESGAVAAEYILLVTVIALGILVPVTAFAAAVSGLFTLPGM